MKKGILPAVLLSFLLFPLWATSQSRPNFVVILTDDQRFDAVQQNGNPVIRTPNLDRLIKRGKNFTNAHVVFSLCSPSRAAILTGRYGSANGVLELGSELNKGERTIANYLKDAGYFTGVSGKWHVDQSPQELGFDFATIFHGNGPYHGRKINDNGKIIQPEEHCDLYCARRSIDFLEMAGPRSAGPRSAGAKSQPFFLFHNTQLPHMDDQHGWPAPDSIRARYQSSAMPVVANRNDDLNGKPEYLKTVRNRTQALKYGYPAVDKIQAHTKDYYSVITEMDAFVGSILQKVEELGITDNTYIVFMSDNGWMLGDHGFTSKVLPYLPSTHVPLAIAGPGIVPSANSSLALNIDLLPTILDLAGIKSPTNVHGESLKGVLADKVKGVREAFVYEGLGSYGGAQPNLMVVSGAFRYIVTYEDAKLNQENFRELYDIQTDPGEMVNLASDRKYSVLVNKLDRLIQSHVKRIVSSK
ncbi:sulfatase-like hydrolase/transferase [Persicitalea jodogahamensis]|uniref:Acetylglucosamine-6-sulfatase n=1 Tax=Persicitalea jodogahamensis TaxID=402147 RepID=A0A8J3D867_9BACT|nr:sulfatase-like hydrolase/transferase [Persicitalea jodogahamensis]GHB87064.1 acetylglucosamine-6-sulfatase [Persicitalea jodogahamensis]